MLTSATKRKIDNARDILVGKIPMPTTQVEQITLALIYKFMSDIDKKSKALGDTSGFFANGYEKYAWDNLMDKSLPARDRVTLYSEGLEKMSKNPHIPQLFRDIFKNAFLPFRSPETLKLFLEQIDEFQYDHSEELGNAFEYLLSVMGSQGDAGQFRTPRHIIDFIVKVVDPSKTDTILDPACGTAGFLISAYKHIREKGLTAEEQKKLTDNFVGYDISHDMQRLAMVNMYLHHFPDPKIFEYDTLSSEDRWDDDFDVILANPPFMTPTGGIRPHSKFSIKTTRAEALFTSYIMEHLNVNGRAGLIIPDGVLNKSETAFQSLRKTMIDSNYLWGIVSLPGGVFNPYSGVKTSILFFDKRIAAVSNDILYIKIEKDGFDLGVQRRKAAKDDLPNAVQILSDYKQSIIKKTNFFVSDNSYLIKKEDIRNADYGLGEEALSKFEENVSDYKLFTIDEIAIELKSGFAYGKANIENNGIAHIRPMNITEEGLFTLEGSKYLPEGIAEEKQEYLLKKDDILFNNTNSKELVGKTCFIENDINSLYSNHMTRIRVDKTKVHPKYLAFLLHSLWRKGYFLKICKKWVGQAGINSTILGNVKIPLPPLSFQIQIISEIEKLRSENATLLEKISKNNSIINTTIDQFWN